MRRARQLRLPLEEISRWGGRRAGAGRKLVAGRASPPHRPRARHHRRWPVHVTWRAREALPSLRSSRVFPFLQRAVAASHKAAFRVVHFSVQCDHVHLVVEGDEADALVRGAAGASPSTARASNLQRRRRRRGAVWNSRYHSRALRTPAEARRGLVYVLLNFRKHLGARPGIDPRSSGPWFAGWRRSDRGAIHGRAHSPGPRGESPVVAPRTWLAAVGWRRAGGAIELDESLARSSSDRRRARGTGSSPSRRRGSRR